MPEKNHFLLSEGPMSLRVDGVADDAIVLAPRRPNFVECDPVLRRWPLRPPLTKAAQFSGGHRPFAKGTRKPPSGSFVR